MFNPFDHPIMFAAPVWLTPTSSWQEHIPFAMFLVSAHRPRVIVELGSGRGDSYFAFCQAVKTLDLPTTSYAFGIELDEDPSGESATGVPAEVAAHHLRYSEFSKLLHRSNRDGLDQIEEGSVDLLHVDRLSNYDSIKRDFELWLPKLSKRGVVLFHNTNPDEEASGASKLWAELRRRYAAFEFLHGRGLGILGVGDVRARELQAIFGADEPDVQHIRDLFFRLGSGVRVEAAQRRVEAELERAQQEARWNREAELLSKRLMNAERLYQAAEERRLKIEPIAQNYLAVTNSTAWKAVMLGWRLQKRLAPPGTRRARLGKLWAGAVWRMVRRLKGDRHPSGVTPQAITSAAAVEHPTAGVAAPTHTAYALWAEKRAPSDPELEAQSELSRTFAYRPLISVLTPVWRTPPPRLRMAIESVRRQSYDHWELCLVVGGSVKEELSRLLEEYARSDQRICVKYLPRNLGIAGNTNEAMRLASGEFVALLDHDDELAPHALFEYVKRLNEDRTIDVFYSDEDKLDEQGRRCHPFFKPDWAPEYFRGVMYVGHLLCFRRSLVDRAGWFDSHYDGVQDFEFMLRLSELTSGIRHVPKILYHWRQSAGSIAKDDRAKPNIVDLQRAAVDAHLTRVGLPAKAEVASSHQRLRISPLPQRDPKMVSIIIPSKDAPDILEKCLATIFGRSSYANYEVVLVDNDTRDPRALAVMKRFAIRRVHLPGIFNYSRANNLGTQYARGSYLLFLNNDTEVLARDWIEHLVYYAEQADIGAAGALLFYPDDKVQHAGVILGPSGAADHLMRGLSRGDEGYAGSLLCAREVSAVTAACLLIKRSDFEAVGGFSEHYFTHYQDVDLCLRLRRMGKRIVFTPRAELVHHESKTRKDLSDHVDYTLLLDQWQDEIDAGDPYYNPNFDPAKTDYSLRD
jgi:O-antigen biosynthesis protein